MKRLIQTTRKLFQIVFNYTNYASVSFIRKHFTWFKNSTENWLQLLDILIDIDALEVDEIKQSLQPVKKELTEVGKMEQKYNVVFSRRCNSINEDYDIYKNQKHIGRLSLSFISKIWGFSFTSNGYARRAANLEGGLLMLINNYNVDNTFQEKTKEYYDLFAS